MLRVTTKNDCFQHLVTAVCLSVACGCGGRGSGLNKSGEPEPTNVKYLRLSEDSIIRQGYERGWHTGLGWSQQWLDTFKRDEERKIDSRGLVQGIQQTLESQEEKVMIMRAEHAEFRQRSGGQPTDEMKSGLAAAEGLLEGYQVLIGKYLR